MKGLVQAEHGQKPDIISMIDYAAFIDSRWHDTVLWVQRMLEAYSMTELWDMEIVRFIKLVGKATDIQKQRMKQESMSRR